MTMEKFLHTIPNEEMNGILTERGPKSLDQRYLKPSTGDLAEKYDTDTPGTPNQLIVPLLQQGNAPSAGLRSIIPAYRLNVWVPHKFIF